jgi:hypothetical protein
MLKILNEEYYLDFDRIEEFVNIPQTKEVVDVKENEEDDDLDEAGQQISIVKYEMIKMMIDVILTEGGEVDEVMGARSSELSIPFKLAFNSLLNKKILNKY